MQPERIEPGPGQESVWDYPRPPRLEPVEARIRVEFGGEVVADSTSAHRVLETSQPPAFYLPPDDVRMDLLRPSTHRSFCEWKGQATYFSVAVGDREAPDSAWTYRHPTPGFEPITDHLAFYAQSMDACWVGEEQVQPMEGMFYGGWITDSVVGPFKGGPGT
ncbi:MAG: DUF427 domain-containing protein, partial [Actinomycetota bacterium]